ncbi:MAG: leucyl aminopeptidase [Hyphomicrobiales bacterium]|nr:MAG: leucyl aminopeptidase [Hyphomicrobiales bacterium]
MNFETDPQRHFVAKAKKPIPISALTKMQFAKIGGQLSEAHKNWASSQGFTGKAGQICQLPDANGKLEKVLYGLGGGKDENPFAHGVLAHQLPAGTYAFDGKVKEPVQRDLGWAMGAYSFDRYRKSKTKIPKLVAGGGDEARRLAQAVYIARDLVNIPANDMGPDALEKAFRKIASYHKAKTSTVKGEQLLKMNFPMVHAVGRASDQAPRILDMVWGNAKHPKITLVGKGVTFDTGGLNIKPGNSMALMKKDMGGAANVLGLAHLIMDAKLPVRLRVIVGAVENSISGNAFRPGDVLPSRKGMSVEIGNTDAEGRLVLGDCLALADEESPELLIDMATLTGAARVALGPDLPPYYTHDDAFARKLDKAALSVHDPLWRMPLWAPYQSMLASKIADVNHITAGGFGGSITAALFLSRFVENAKTWSHFDVFAWVPIPKPWAPVGGEAQGIRALYEVIKSTYKS